MALLLDIANTSLEVSCDNDDIDKLADLYRGFTTTAVTPQSWKLHAEYWAGFPRSEQSARMQIDGSNMPWKIRTWYLVGTVDPRSRTVAVRYRQHYAFSTQDGPLVLTFVVRSVTCLIAVLQGALPVHASGIVLDNLAHGFLGPSGAGKTTIAKQLVAARGATMLADDICIASMDADGPRLHATPFSGRNQPIVERGRGSAPWRNVYAVTQATSELGWRELLQPDAYRLLLRGMLLPEGDDALVNAGAETVNRFFPSLTWRHIGFDLNAETTASFFR